jgi:hypothetical protein
MLPGFRLVLMSIVLAASVLIFGLGAAALLRATHEEFANLPRTWSPQPPIVIAEQPAEPAPATPSLALLHVAPPPPENEPVAVEQPVLPPVEETREEIITDLATPEPSAPDEPAAPEPAIASIEVQPAIVDVQPVLVEAPPPTAAIKVAVQPARHVRKVVRKKRRVVRRIVRHRPEPQQVPQATNPFPFFGG